MWKHVIIAASFEIGWAINNPVTGIAVLPPTVMSPDMDGVANVILELNSAFRTFNLPEVGTTGQGTAAQSRNGVSGTFNVTSSNPVEFHNSASDHKNAIEEWMAHLLYLPQASVVVTIPPAPTQPPPAATAAPALPSSGPAVAPDSPDPVPGVIQMTYELTLPMGASEISSRLGEQTPAAILAGLNAHLPPAVQGGAPLVTDARVQMDPVNATTPGVNGALVLSLTDLALFETHGDSLRTVIAALANVFLGDVGPITFATTLANGPTPPPLTNQPDVGPQTEERRLVTSGSLLANFHIQVPGHAALGYKKDCSLQKVSASAMVLDPSITNPDTQSSPSACATSTSACVSSDCTVWTWDSTEQSCIFGNAMSLLLGANDDQYQAGSITQRIGGSDSCGACPTASPSTTWPAATIALSHAAFGDTQPLNLQCWPKNSAFDLMPCGYQVLEDIANTEKRWLGRCNNLAGNEANTQALCQKSCVDDAFCTVWMWATNEGRTRNDSDAVTTCFTGNGNNCWTPSQNTPVGDVIAAQRIQHGQVNVIVDNFSSRIVEGLQNQFWENVGQDADEDGTPDTALTTAELQKAACQAICHSNIMCSYWQSFYNDGTSADLGCWVENPGVESAGQANQAGGPVGGFVPYPLTDDGMRAVAVPAEPTHLTGGQFIQHHCEIPFSPVRPAATTTTTSTPQALQAGPVVTPAPDSGSSLWLWGILGVVAAACLAAAALAFFLCQTKPVKKRGIIPPLKKKTPAPPPAAAAAPPQPVVPLMSHQMQFVVQPTIPQPLAMSMIASPVTTFAQAQAVAQPTYASAPQATYATAPQFRPAF